jgi:hypothetical protein
MCIYICLCVCVCVNTVWFLPSLYTELLDGYFQEKHFYKCYDWALTLVLLIPQQKLFYQKSLRLKIHSPASTEEQGNYMKYVNFLWSPMLLARDLKRLAWVLHTSSNLWLHSSGSYWLHKNCPYTQYSVMSNILFPANCSKMISDQKCFCYDIQ